MTAQRGVRSLPDAHWISLDQALAWICFDEAFDIDVLLTSAASDMGLTPGEAKTRYQEAWRDFAEQASRRGFEIRGRRRSLRKTENYMRQLSADDLFNCRFVDFDRTTHGRTIFASRLRRGWRLGSHVRSNWLGFPRCGGSSQRPLGLQEPSKPESHSSEGDRRERACSFQAP